MKKTVLLAILDGFGLRDNDHGNAVTLANKPNIDRLFATYPHTTLRADGNFVGLPAGQMGNSEVGHLNIGAGRIIYQSLERINKAIEEDTLKDMPEIKSALDNGVANGLHLLGLLSPGGVHSHIDHLFALIDNAKAAGVTNLYIHPILDGRDVDPKSAIEFVEQLQNKLEEVGIGQIATISGRYYAMDRDKRWERVELAYDTIVSGKADQSFTDPIEYIKASYANDVVDEFILPAVNANVNVKFEDNTSVINFNFRPDRAMQLAGVLTNPEYNPQPEENPVFTPSYRPTGINFVQMMKYSDDVKAAIAFKHIETVNTLGEVVSAAGMQQLRIAETEKYPHVTFFFDGGVDKAIEGSKRVLINSPKVATYDLQPEMSAPEVTKALLEELDKDYLDLVILNFANPDMVGHSGMLEPTIKAIEAVDTCLGQVIEKIEAIGGSAIVTADHGNADLVLNDDESPNTAHTANPVPAIVVGEGYQVIQRDDAKLADIAPTLLTMLGVEIPEDMTGTPFINA
ncbi:2,3-bisphosphoglycerate-independent phosphoglycerate mutase [Mollicutes bacterium LVI A0039]|nr:2,3-bisphosphoglycerate-independent phosphoglycerate mutase [Mollicutes bacterium LVI A0039]